MTDKEIMVIMGSIIVLLLLVCILFGMQFSTEANTYYYHLDETITKSLILNILR